ncbi:ABC transporter ATP-binding protein [Aminobacter sp. LjRoot7]|uniref:ABC transporter ATP-binding protein n=1 Tax=Aminobacter sp. LjRoot7 TaxID=3342335 RepID=UPI003ED08FE7
MLDVAAIDAFYAESHILHQVSLTVAERQRVAVLGRNGAGKSTLLKSIMNAGTTVRGGLSWRGASIEKTKAHERARKGIALVPEDRRIYTHMTVLENISFARFGVSRRVALKEARDVIASIPMLSTLGERMGGELSGGQQQMLAVARGLAAKPSLLLLDEPTEGLAPVIVEQMATDILARCEAEGIALLLCEQNVWFARKCTDHVYVIDTGRIVFGGSWGDFDGNPEIADKYLAV